MEINNKFIQYNITMKTIMNNVIFKFLSSSLACFNERGILLLLNLHPIEECTQAVRLQHA